MSNEKTALALQALLDLTPPERGLVLCWFCDACHVYIGPGETHKCEHGSDTWPVATAQCQGLRVALSERDDNMKRCVRCGCTSAYPIEHDFARCPVLRGELWQPRPTSDGRWDL